MDKITRLLILYSSLINSDEINKTMFCFENDCSPRSFDRDIEDIRLFLNEVYSVSELKYNRMKNTYYLEGSKKQGLEVMEYLFIEKILRDVSVLRNDEFSVLKSHLLMNTRDTSKWLVSSNIKSRYKTPAHNKAILKICGDLELAIRSLKYIRMVHQDDIGEKNISNMIPCNIRYQAGHLYFMGYTEEDKAVNIKLERIYSFEVLREQTVDERKRGDGYIKAYVERGSSDFGGDSTEMIVECGGDDYKRLCNNFSNVKVLHESDNRVKIRFDSSEEKFIYWYFEHWSESVTIIAPLQIKEKLITQAQKILRKYGGTDWKIWRNRLMAKKIRFPLEMENGIEVRSMEELRNNFSLGRVLEYVQNEKLGIWLRDRYENNIADAIAELDKMDPELPRKVSEIFDIPYDEKIEDDLKQAVERAERIKRLKEFTDEEQYADKIDNVAFDQDELYDLLDEEVNEVYLCGDRFAIPLSVKGISYKGINNPVVVIDSKTEVDWLAKEILLEAVRYDDKYQAVVDSANATKEVLDEKLVETVKKQASRKISIGSTPEKTYLSFMIPVPERESAKKMYILAKDAIENLNYDADADVIGMKKLVHDNSLIGLADRYISEL